MIFQKTASHKSRLFRRNDAATKRSSAPVETLERRVVFSSNPAEVYGSNTLGQLSHLSPTTCGCPGCSAPSPAAIEAAANFPAMPAQFPLADTFKLHSLPTATKRIYLDFDGHTTNDPAWNNGIAFTTPAYSVDSTPAFSETELQNIQEIWARVAEDFSPFEVDVTTEEPSLDDLRNTGDGDSRWGIRVVIGENTGWYAPVGGVAMIGSFSWSTDTPCFAFNKSIIGIAEVSTHEVGHTLGLWHDATIPANPRSNEYYAGHGTGMTSWGPIMGASYSRALTQWSKGEYRDANNSEDDLSIITTGNGFGYRQDDHGSELSFARVMSADTITGIIEQNTDVDVFQFVVGGSLKASIQPITVGANLDVLAEILDSNGSVIATSNPSGAIGASFNLAVLPGRYFLRVQGTGEGDPLQTGYTKYGSLGQYSVTVENVATEPVVLVSNPEVIEGDAGETTAEFTIELLTAAVTPVTTWFATRDGSATSLDEDYVATTGFVVFAPGELTKTVSVQVRGDGWRERDETFSLAILGVDGGVIGTPYGTCTIANDDTFVTAQLLPAAAVEATGSTRSTLEFTIRIRGTADAPFFLAFATRDGSATANRDYRPNSGSFVVAPGQSEKRVSVSIIGDRLMEPDETVNLFVTAYGANNIRVTGPSDSDLGELTANVTSGFILDDDSRFLTLQTVNSSVAAGSTAQFAASLRRRPGYGEALPTLDEFSNLPTTVLEAMAGQIQFTASFMAGHTAIAGMPRRPKLGALDFREGTVSFGYHANPNGGFDPKNTDIVSVQTDAVSRRRQLTVQLYAARNATLGSRVTAARVSVTPALAAGFASFAQSPAASTSRRR